MWTLKFLDGFQKIARLPFDGHALVLSLQQGNFQDISRIFPGHFPEMPWNLPGIFPEVSWTFPGLFLSIFCTFPGIYLHISPAKFANKSNKNMGFYWFINVFVHMDFQGLDGFRKIARLLSGGQALVL